MGHITLCAILLLVLSQCSYLGISYCKRAALTIKHEDEANRVEATRGCPGRQACPEAGD